MKQKKTGSRAARSPTPLSSKDVTIRLTGAGDLIDARFRTTPESLAPGPIYLQDEATGIIATLVSVPRLGRLVTRRAKVKAFSYGLFINPQDSIKAGSIVTLVVGGFKKEHLTVAS
jgi:hypothetical protein